MMSSLDNSLREEVSMLRKKVVKLETAESDNKRLRKEISKLKMNAQEEKSKFELDFMNQLSEVIRENAMKMEEITGQLQESINVNRGLNEQSQSKCPCPEVAKRDLKHQNENETSQLMNKSDLQLSEVERMKRQLYAAEKSRDDLIKKLGESTKSLNDLKRSTNRFPNSTLTKGCEAPTNCKTQTVIDITPFEDENRSLKNTISSLQKENNKITVALHDYKFRKVSDSNDNEKDVVISKLEKETQIVRNSAMQIENESRDLINSSRNESSAEQTRECGKLQSLSSEYPKQRQGSENCTSRIIEQLEQNLKSDGQKEKKSLTMNGKSGDEKLGSLKVEEKDLNGKVETEINDSHQLQNDSKLFKECYESQISKLEDELLSTKDLLALEKDISSKQEKDLNFKFEALHDTLSNSESSRASLAHENERLVAQLNGITEKKIQLEQNAKHQHRQLKQLQKVVEENLNKVEKKNKSDEIQIQCLQDEVESLKRELLRSQCHVSQMNKTIEKEETESNVENLAKMNKQCILTQMHKLQKELSLRCMEMSKVEHRHKNEINVLESTLESVSLELRECVKVRDEEKEKLRRISKEKDDVCQSMEKERDLLVLSMQDMMKNRRYEVDDLQNEMVEMNTRLANENRKVSLLKSRLEQSNSHIKEIGRLRKKITELSRPLALKKDIEHTHGNSSREKENRELRRRLKEVLAERSIAENKLLKFVSG